MRACGPSAAFGGANGRRLCTFCYYRNPRTETELAGARWRVAGNCRGMLSRTHPDDTLFHRHWVANRRHNPARAYSIERLRSLGFLAVDATDEPLPGPAAPYSAASRGLRRIATRTTIVLTPAAHFGRA